MSIFQNSVLKTFKQDESLIASRYAAYQNYKAKVEAIKDFKEEEYQDGFLKDIFELCLGYTLKTSNPNSFNLEREKKNETDSKKADGVFYLDNKIIGVIELKAQDTKNLDKVQQQAFYYLSQHSNAQYVIISNFDELRFYIEKSTAYEKFNLFNLDYEKFKKLHLMLSFESIKEQIPLKIKEKSNLFEQNISKELYKDFSDFRTALFDNIVKNNFGTKVLTLAVLDKSTLLRLTQKLCDRIIFILFAEDRGLLNTNTIKEIREEFTNQKFTSYKLYDIYKFYFEAINNGNDKLQIPKYNGGLFAKDELLDSLIIDDEILDEKAQKLSNYDFVSEISVNILGHIFEQSLTDLEELQANIENIDFDKSKSKRKKDGVFYTPEYITKYIVENTLGKICKEKREELNIGFIGTETLVSANKKAKEQIKQNLLTYKDWLLNLKILDPACGSGAFLNQALEFLINEHKILQNDLALMGDLFASYMVEETVLENNLYGVDINEDAVEIAKLSLWLRTAQKGRVLTKLSDKIKCGNSLIDDKSVVSNAFVWEEEFKEIFENGGFDIVIGNPPYVRSRELFLEKEKAYFINKYCTTSYQLDLYKLFIELSINLLKSSGYLSFITPSAFLVNDFDKPLRKYILDNYNLSSFATSNQDIFEDASVKTVVFTIIKNKKSDKTNIFSIENSEIIFKYDILQTIFIEQDYIINEKINMNNLPIIQKIGKHLALKNFFEVKNGIKVRKELLFNNIKNENYKPFILGKNIFKYSNTFDDIYIDYTLENEKLYTNQAFRSKEIFEQEKLVIRQILGKNIVTTYDDKKLYTDQTTYIINRTCDNQNLKYLLSLLNSKLMFFYFINKFSDNKIIFPKIKGSQILELPYINLSNQKPFIEKADLMLELNKKLQETKENFISELKLEKVPTKLQKFEELEFDDFVKEYSKTKKIKFADKLEERNFKNDWQRLFENDKKEVLEIQEQINITDKEIDNMVYKLYDLTEDEINIVEEK
ncbi:Eco57I restriction-modification methylase domain-containing protein [Arcobacter vandammei]|uniref:Eco57I restriction-modification methylase domain-containing protein n=1 Tax=Arcobacter vandammei TaxID=2782243 RepID=UPI0018DF34FF|nr:TaqI-like C-terminal specificity domain-containing protein [Arcobacter vandammei]